MVVELVFSENEESLHSIAMESGDFMPVPAIADRLQFGDNTYEVTSRTFQYSSGDESGMVNDARVTIALSCRLIGGPEHEKRMDANVGRSAT
jgi:hypothetical protein